jgi:hypothetical protein
VTRRTREESGSFSVQAMAHAAVGTWGVGNGACCHVEAWVARPGRCRVSLLRFRHIYRTVLAEEVHAAPRRPTYVFYCRHGSTRGTRHPPRSMPRTGRRLLG